MTARSKVRSGFRVRSGSFPADTEAVTRLWRSGFSSFAGPHAEERADQVHQANPAGEGVVAVLETEEGVAAGVQTAIARRVEGPGGEARWGTLADFTVSSEHRTLGPALKLLKGTLRMAEESLDLVYGPVTPQARAVCTRAGLQPVCRMTVYRRPLRVAELQPTPEVVRRNSFLSGIADLGIRILDSYRAGRWSRKVRVSATPGIPGEVDRLWAERAPSTLYASRRDLRTLRWRFRKPLEEGGITGLVARDPRTGSPLGYLLLHVDDGQATVVDFFVGVDSEALAGLLTHATERAREAGASVLSVEFAGPDTLHRTVRRMGFFPREAHAIHAADLRGSDVNWSGGVLLTSFDRAPS